MKRLPLCCAMTLAVALATMPREIVGDNTWWFCDKSISLDFCPDANAPECPLVNPICDTFALPANTELHPCMQTIVPWTCNWGIAVQCPGVCKRGGDECFVTHTHFCW